MSKNVLMCAAGTALGFVLGFFVTNAVTKPGAPAASARPAADSQAGPLGPDQVSGELPPGHPDVGGGEGAETDGGSTDGGSAAPASEPAQAAADKADRAPKDFDAQLDAARAFYRRRDYEKAALYGDRALAVKADDFDALVLVGNARYDAQDFAAAAGLYERALAVRPDSPDVRTDLGNTYFNRKDYERAVAEYRKSVALDPNHLNSWKNIAAAAVQKGDKALLAEAVGRLSKLAPQAEETEAYRQKLSEMQ